MSDTLINILGLTIGWGLIALGALLILRALFADRSRGRRRCPRCWYSMDGAPSLPCRMDSDCDLGDACTVSAARCDQG